MEGNMEKKRRHYNEITDYSKGLMTTAIIELYLQGRSSEIEGALDDIFEIFDEAERIYKNRN